MIDQKMEDETSIIEVLNGSDEKKVNTVCRHIIKQRQYSAAVSRALEPWIWKGNPVTVDIVMRAYQHMGDEAYRNLMILFERIQSENISETAIINIVWAVGLFPNQYRDLYDKLSCRILKYSGKLDVFLTACAHTLAGVLIEFKKTGIAYDENVLNACKAILEDERRANTNGSANIALRDMDKAGL